MTLDPMPSKISFSNIFSGVKQCIFLNAFTLGRN